MFRANSEDLMRSVHVDSLKQQFPSTHMAGPDTFLVDDSSGQIGVTSRVGGVSLYVTLPPEFPAAAPRIATITGRPVTLPHVPWDKSSLLAEFVAAAFKHLRLLWGSVAAASMADVPDLSSLPRDVVIDLCQNPLCLESFIHQVPYCKRLRQEAASCIDRLEAAATENLAHKTLIDSLTKDIKDLQAEIHSHTAALEDVHAEASTLLRFGTHEGLLAAYVQEANAIKVQSESVAKSVLGTKDGLKSEDLDAALEEYGRLRKKWHERDIKRRAFLSSHPLQRVNH